MNAQLVALLCVLLLPLFLGSWRMSLLGLACQGWLMAWLSFDADGSSWAHMPRLADLALLRGSLAPWLFYRVLSRYRTSARNDVIPPNLLSWGFALAGVLLAFNFADVLAHDSDSRAPIAVATCGVLLGFLVLSTQGDMFGKIVGMLRVENAIALFELSASDTAHASPLWLAVGQPAIFAATVLLYRWHLLADFSEPPKSATWEETW